MELCIALLIGAWFLICGVVSYLQVSKSFKTKDEENKK